MKTIFSIIILLAVTITLVACVRGHFSKSGNPPGLVNGKLAPCPNSPNCAIYSTNVDAASAANKWAALQAAIKSTGGVVNTQNENYLAATYTSKLMKFVDDLEAHWDAEENTISLRSASRVGYSDLGVNQKRIDQIIDAWQ